MASRTASSSRGNARASVARRTHAIVLLDAAYAIPLAIVFGICALLFARGAQGRIRSTLERAGGRSRVRWSRQLAVLGIAIALSASLAVGFY